jgi:hypothetical protein
LNHEIADIDLFTYKSLLPSCKKCFISIKKKDWQKNTPGKNARGILIKKITC